MKIVLLLGSWMLILAHGSHAQDTIVLSLSETLVLAVEQSIDLKIAQSETAEQEAAFQNAILAFRPQLFLDATLPNLNRSIESRPLPDGSDAFVNRSTMYNGVGFDLNYQVEKTGGLLSLSSTIERLDVFGTKQFDYQRTYFVNPISIGYTQPLFAFNQRRWEKERLSLLYTEFKERYARTREEIILEAILLFKDCFLAYERVKLAQQKIIETDSLLAIKTRLFNLGQSSRTEILRLTLDQQTNRQEELTEILNWQQFQMELADFLNLDRSGVILLEEPEPFQETAIPLDQAMAYATNNRYIRTTQERELAEARVELEKAQKDREIDLSVQASLGLNNSSEDLGNLFNPLLDREIFTASLRLPLTGWKKYEYRQKIAEERIQQESLRQQKERIELSREAFRLVTDFELLRTSLSNQQTRRSVANEILQLTSQQFLLGDASYTDLSVASRERDQAILDYYNTLLDIIEQYYQIRKLCMFDFLNGKELREG